MNAYEKDYTDSEVEDYINEVSENVCIGNLTYHPGMVLRLVDRIAFDCLSSELPARYVCDECGEIYEDDEDKAEACCQPDLADMLEED